MPRHPWSAPAAPVPKYRTARDTARYTVARQAPIKNGGPKAAESVVELRKKEKTSAPTYSPRTLRSKYHRRSCVSRPSSEWDGVEPQRCEHGGVQQFCTSTKPAGRAREVICEERKKIKTSTDEAQSAESIAGRALLASNPVIFRESYQVNPVRHLILGSASRLDAFSGYPIRT